MALEGGDLSPIACPTCSWHLAKGAKIVSEKINLPEKVIATSETIQTQNEQFNQIIEIKKDGNYIDNKLCSLEEIAKRGRNGKRRVTTGFFF